MSQDQGVSAHAKTEPTEKKERKERKKKGSGVLNQLGDIAKSHEKTGKEIEKARNEARAAEVAKDERDARLVKLVRTGFGAKFEGTVRNNINYEEDDLAFFRTFGFNV
jgi:hypothetical protein